MFNIILIIFIILMLALALVGGGYLFETWQICTFSIGMCITGGVIIALVSTLVIFAAIIITKYPEEFKDILNKEKDNENK